MSSRSPRPASDAPTAAPGERLRRSERISAAVDGDAECLSSACQAFRDGDARARADWHAYHLIGDVMRSSELASSPARDAAFVDALRRRLAAEPVVMAPAPRPASKWRVPAAAVASAAGVAVVAGVLVMSRSGSEVTTATALPATASPPALVAPRQGTTPWVAGPGGFVRDPRLEEFMRVHQGAAGGLSLPRVDVRQVEFVATPAAPR